MDRADLRNHRPPLWRPPYGAHDERTDELAASIGYTSVLMWNGSYGDSTPIRPREILALARECLHPGVVMLGHANYPEVTGTAEVVTQFCGRGHVTGGPPL